MTFFSILTIVALMLSCGVAYIVVNCNWMEGALISRKISCRLVEVFYAVLILIVAEIYAPNVLIRSFPIGVGGIYAIFLLIILQTKKKHGIKLDGRQERPELIETVLNTGISATLIISSVLLVLTFLSGHMKGMIKPSSLDIPMCFALLLSANTALLLMLCHALAFMWKNPEGKEEANGDLLRLRKKLRTPPTMK